MMYDQVFMVASSAMGREQLRIRQAATNIANAGVAFSRIDAGDAAVPQQEPVHSGSGGTSTVDDLATIMIASRMYEANVAVISAARAAFEKALEISGRR